MFTLSFNSYVSFVLCPIQRWGDVLSLGCKFVSTWSNGWQLCLRLWVFALFLVSAMDHFEQTQVFHSEVLTMCPLRDADTSLLRQVKMCPLRDAVVDWSRRIDRGSTNTVDITFGLCLLIHLICILHSSYTFGAFGTQLPFDFKSNRPGWQYYPITS